MDFPIGSLLDPPRCYAFLVDILHPKGLCCPNGHPLDQAFVHKRDRRPILDYRCRTCRRCFNVFTGTLLQGIKHDVVKIVQLLRGILQGVSTAQLAREMAVDRKELLGWRHPIQGHMAQTRPAWPLPDPITEADEMYQNAGEKRRSALGPPRPAASPRQQDARPRHLGQRPAAGGGRRRA